MQITGIAINADATRLDGSLDLLRSELDYFGEAGFDHVEIAPHGVGALLNGELCRKQMELLLQVLGTYPFSYLVHGPNPMNLMDREAPQLELRMFRASLEFAEAIGAPVLVYHAGRFLPEERFQLPAQDSLTPAYTQQLWDLERGLLQELGEVAAQHGVVIAIENARPYLDASPYCYGEFLASLAAMARQVAHPRVRVALDLGHAYLAACHHGYDLLEGVAAVAPYVGHVHLHDNFGRCCASYEKKQGELLATGRGDLHLPVGWGEVPAREVFDRLQDYRGAVTLEIRPRYRPYCHEALINARALLGI